MTSQKSVKAVLIYKRMKAFILFTSILTVNFALYANEYCSPSDHAAKIEQLAEQNCDVTDKVLSCAEKTVDPEVMKNRIQRMLGIAEEVAKKGKDELKLFMKYNSDTPIASLFDTSENQITPVFDWFLKDNKNENVNKDELKQAFILQYTDYAKKFDCIPIVKHRLIYITFPEKLKTQSLTEINTILARPEIKESTKEYFTKKNSQVLSTKTICSSAYVNKGPWVKVSDEFPPCAGNVTTLFKDNDWKSSSNALNDPNSSGVVACIKERMSKGAQIDHISIQSSSSALNNTGEAAKKFCKKGFLALSQARAEDARDVVLPALLKLAGTNQDYSANTKIIYNGTNDDGTSGPCPYSIINGKEVLKNHYKTAKGKKELDEDKFVKIHVTFSSNNKKSAKNEAEYAPLYSCKEMYFECK
jgi:hypothetical protein